MAEKDTVGDLEAVADGKGAASSSKTKTSLEGGLGHKQVRLRSNKRFRLIVAIVTMFACLVDILGTAITCPALAALCAYAEGGPVDAINGMTFPGTPTEQALAKAAQIKETISPYAFSDPKPPVKFSLSMNIVLSAGQFGSAFGSLFFGRMCDAIGCKLPMQICLFMGLIGYVMIYAAGPWFKSYWLFAAGILWNNFFGNTIGVAQVYFGQMYTGEERDMYVSCTMAMGLIGASIGALIVMPFVLNPANGANYFNSIWIAIGLTVAAFLLVTFVLVKPEKQEKEVVEKVQTPKMAFRILVITVIASAFDSAGDEGTRMARGTIMSNLFPEWSTVAKQNYLLIAMIGVIICCMVLLDYAKKLANYGVLAVFGCFCTLLTQVVLMIDNIGAAPYIIIWHVGKFFGFFSTFCSSFIVQDIAPTEQLGYWNGWNEAWTNIASAVAPLIFAPVYDGFKNLRGQQMLACTAGVSTIALLCYTPLIGMLPKKPKQKTEKDELQDLAVYEQMPNSDFSQLPLEIQDKVNEQFMEKGKPIKTVSWGKYEDEREKLPDLQKRTLPDFTYITQSITGMLTDRKSLLKAQEEDKKMKEAFPDLGDDSALKAEMGAWIADYFDDAGYADWRNQPQVFKSMLMSAFSPIDPLNGSKPDFGSMPPEQFENNMTEFLRVMDGHMAAEKRRLNLGFGAGTFMVSLRRR